MIVFVSLALSGGMPAITIVSFFAILFRFIYFKYIFLRYCKIPKAFDEALDNKVMVLMQYSLLIHFMISIWMFGVSSIFNQDSISFSSSVFIILCRFKTWTTAFSLKSASSLIDSSLRGTILRYFWWYFWFWYSKQSSTI